MADIQKALMPLVGWDGGFSKDEAVSPDLMRSESGLYFQQAHPLLTLRNMRAVMPDGYGSQFAEWAEGTSYAAGAVVSHAGRCWEASEKTEEEPGDGSAWTEYDLFSDYLRRVTLSGVTKAVQTFLATKSVLKESRPLIASASLYDGSGRLTNLVQNQGRIVGYEIKMKPSVGVTAVIESVGLQMRGAQGAVRIYLFRSSQPDPVGTVEISATGSGYFEWRQPKLWNVTAGGGDESWYVVYDQRDLPSGMTAVNFTRDWGGAPCGTCNPGSVRRWREISKVLSVRPFKADSGSPLSESPVLWDSETELYTNSVCYGLNLKLSAGCDLTDFIIEQRGLFAVAVQRQVAYDALKAMLMNAGVRVNREQSNVSASELRYELDGMPEGRASGMGHDLKRTYEAIMIDTRGIDSLCLSCERTGVKLRAM